MGWFGLGSDSPAKGSGFVAGYVIEDRAFRDALELTGKDRAWNYPTNLAGLIADPAPLILREQWYYDPGSFAGAVKWLSTFGKADPAPLVKLFKCRGIFKKKRVEGWLLEERDAEDLTRLIGAVKQKDLLSAIAPLEKVYGSDYASPSNYQFEAFNAGVMGVIARKYPELTPLDDALRAPVYQVLAAAPRRPFTQEIKALQKIIQATRPPVAVEHLEHTLLPVPRIPRQISPKDFARLHSNRGAEQLREIVDVVLSTPLSDKDISEVVQEAKGIARALSPKKEIVYALGEITGAGFSAAASFANPIFLIPAIGLGALGVHKFWGAMDDLSRSRSLKWLDVAERIAPLEASEVPPIGRIP